MKTKSPLAQRMLLIFAVPAIVLYGCQLADEPPDSQPTDLSKSPRPTEQAVADPTPTHISDAVGPAIELDYSQIAQQALIERVEVVLASPEGPYWEAVPEHWRVTLAGYPVADSIREPQIFVFPVDGLVGINQAAARTVDELRSLLKTGQTHGQLPYMPLSNLAQAMQVRVDFIEFLNGRGIRFVTQLSQGPVPITNHELIYTFQGLTSDERYYISAVLPVSHPSLPGSAEGIDPIAPQDHAAYISNLGRILEDQDGESFTPSIQDLDKVVRSLRIR